MAILLEDKVRNYQRIRLNTTEKKQLIKEGLTPVLSSNVSAIGKEGASLIVRFHGGATYEYPRSGKLYARMLNSYSKGKFVWNQLRRKNVPYNRIANIPMKYDQRIKDRDLMEEVEIKKVNKDRLTTKQTIESMIKDTRIKTMTPIENVVKQTIKQVKPKRINPYIATTLVAKEDIAIGIITALAVSDILKERTFSVTLRDSPW